MTVAQAGSWPDETDFAPAVAAGPWTRSLLAMVAAVDVVAFAVIVAAWYGISRSLSVDRHLPWLCAAVAALTLSALGHAYLLAVTRRGLGLQMMAAPPVLAVPRFEESKEGRPMTDHDFVAIGEMRMYHRAGCPFVAGKPAGPASAAAHRSAGREPCGICRP